jgi:fructokinase
MKQTTRPFTIIGIGEILWDNLPAGRQLGGAPANFAFHAQALGARGIAASCVGRDPDGDEILRRLQSLGLSTEALAVDPDHPTGTVDVHLDAAGVPTFIIRENVAWDFIPLTNELRNLAASADAICFGSLAQRGEVSRRTIQAVLDAAGPRCLRIFDINLRQHFYSRPIIEQSLRRSSVLKLNDGELPVVAKLLKLEGDEAAVARGFIDRYGMRLVALTRGDKGSTLFAPGSRHDHPGIRTTIADTVGAGDAFTAAVAVGLLKGQDLDQINQRANRLAAYVCSQPGATPTVPAEVIGTA